CITSDIAPAALDQLAGMDAIAGAIERLFGPDTGLSSNDLRRPAVPYLREGYAALLDTDRFHPACRRISPSHGWYARPPAPPTHLRAEDKVFTREAAAASPAPVHRLAVCMPHSL